MPVCEACRSVVPEVTHEFEDALCDLCLEIQRYDRKIGMPATDTSKAPFTWLTAKPKGPKKPTK